MGRREYLREKISKLEAELESMDRFGEDIYLDGQVLRFDKMFPRSGIRYSYAAIKTDGLWWTTGPKSTRGYSWDELCGFMNEGVSHVYVAKGYEEIK